MIYSLTLVKPALITEIAHLHVPKLQKLVVTTTSDRSTIWHRDDRLYQFSYALTITSTIDDHQIVSAVASHSPSGPTAIEEIWLALSAKLVFDKSDPVQARS
jgi:hypothetical protein